MCDCKKDATPIFNAYEAMVRQAERKKKCQCKDCNCEDVLPSDPIQRQLMENLLKLEVEIPKEKSS
jgi:hypothetical protein